MPQQYPGVTQGEQKKPDMQITIMTLNDEVVLLGSLIETLAQRLVTVLPPQLKRVEGQDKQPEPPPMSPLRRELEGMRKTLFNYNRELEEILRNLEL